MVEAARHFRGVLDEAEIHSPDIQVLSNYTGTFHDSDSHTIKSCLFWQLFNPVLWNNNLIAAADSGIDRSLSLEAESAAAKHRPRKNPISRASSKKPSGGLLIRRPTTP
ncbi:MAG: hypothetical protein CM1200mP20_15740 [Pseudomonadota bacterium]|nr:MAG: hypothetical protein CM1200mP20_15740 [Pseudomonadota bacterium]